MSQEDEASYLQFLEALVRRLSRLSRRESRLVRVW